MKDLCTCLKIEMQRSFPSLTMTARGASFRNLFSLVCRPKGRRYISKPI